MYITEPARSIPVIYEADICVVGGSCTGVFAAVRAAALGANVVIVEKLNCFGGTATAGMVNVWHSLLDTDHKEQIIGGLTAQVEEILLKTNAACLINNESVGCRFNSARLSVVLDRLVTDHHIKAYLHTVYSCLCRSGDRIDAIIVENKDGRGAIKAKFFIDATGDGLLARDLGIPAFRNDPLQPPTSCFLAQLPQDASIPVASLIKEHGAEFGLDDDWGWSGPVPGADHISFRADNHVFHVDCSKADDLTLAEIQGRRKAAAFCDMVKKYDRNDFELISLCQSIGVRETLHYETVFQAKEHDLLIGRTYEHTIMRGTYRVDIHHQHDNGITFKYLDGRKVTMYGKDSQAVYGNWREELGITSEPAKYYSVPWDILVQTKYANFIAVGRMLNADKGAFGALRVMVNLNQLGEAAGVGAALCADEQVPVFKVAASKVCAALKM